MRVLFTCQAALPHLYPLVPLAWACRAAGHEVRIASEAKIVDQIVHTGLHAVGLTDRPQLSAENRDRLVAAIYTQGPWPLDWALNLAGLSQDQRDYLELIGRSLIGAADAVANELTEFARQWRPDLVVYDAVSFAGTVVAQTLGVPAVRHLFGTASLPRIELAADGSPLPEYERLFASRGLPTLLDPVIAVDPTPPSMRLATEANRIDMRYVPYNGAGIEPDWLREPLDRPRVCITWGHTSARALGVDAARPYREAIESLLELGVEMVVASTEQQLELLGPLPERTRAVASVPLHLILPHCDLLVQQGGDGTTLTAASVGVPSLAITRKPDAELPAGRLATVGAGMHLRLQELPPGPDGRETVRSAAEKLLVDPAYREAAGRLRAEIEAAPPPAEVVPALAALT